MTVPSLTREQRERIGHLIWAHIDGVAANVDAVIRAINADALCGIRIVASEEWDRCRRLAKQVPSSLALPRLTSLRGPV
jgi:BMFP domain-containing protein YqiC